MLLGPLITMMERLSHGKEGKKMGVLVHRPNREDLELLKDLLIRGSVTPVVDKSYNLTRVKDAFRYYGEGLARGKVVIIIDEIF
jgi:NADPH:quinone reductase-like Zn-dependent oxidoreductase